MTELQFHALCILALWLGGAANTCANYLLWKRVRYLESKRRVVL